MTADSWGLQEPLEKRGMLSPHLLYTGCVGGFLTWGVEEVAFGLSVFSACTLQLHHISPSSSPARAVQEAMEAWPFPLAPVPSHGPGCPGMCRTGHQLLDPEGQLWGPSGHVEVLHLPGENTQGMGEGESVFKFHFGRFCLVAAIVTSLVSVEKVAEGFRRTESEFGREFRDHQPASFTLLSESSTGRVLL